MLEPSEEAGHQEKPVKEFPDWPEEPDNSLDKRAASRLHFYLIATYVIGMLLSVCMIGGLGGNLVLLALVPLLGPYVAVWEYPYIVIPTALMAFVVYAYGRTEAKQPVAILGLLLMMSVWLGSLYWYLQHPEFLM